LKLFAIVTLFMIIVIITNAKSFGFDFVSIGL